MKIAIYNHGIAFDGSTPFRQPLGGSESSIVYMAHELARCGHEVTVYCNTPSPSGTGQGEGRSSELSAAASLEASPYRARASRQRPLPKGEARYCPYHQFFTDYTAIPWDALISFRSFDPFLLGRVAPRMIYWTGDACDQPALKDFEHPALQENIDLVFCVSSWHRHSFIDIFDLPRKRLSPRAMDFVLS